MLDRIIALQAAIETMTREADRLYTSAIWADTVADRGYGMRVAATYRAQFVAPLQDMLDELRAKGA